MSNAKPFKVLHLVRQVLTMKSTNQHLQSLEGVGVLSSPLTSIVRLEGSDVFYIFAIVQLDFFFFMNISFIFGNLKIMDRERINVWVQEKGRSLISSLVLVV
jgi:hypothetical protein